MNVQFLEHDYNTDVITFDNSVEQIVSGEIYVSIDTVKENASNYKISLKLEVLRVFVHGVLHLLGYDDKTNEQRAEMRLMENRWIDVFEL